MGGAINAESALGGNNVAQVIDLEKIKQVAGGKDIEALTCHVCGNQVWVPLVDDNGWVAVLACAGYMEDGAKCENIIDLDEWIEY